MGWMDWLGGSSGRVPEAAPEPIPPRALALYETRACPYCHRVRRALARLDVEVESRDLSVGSHRADLIAATGRSTVPCLFIDGTPLFESLDIIAWLEAYAAAKASKPAS